MEPLITRRTGNYRNNVPMSKVDGIPYLMGNDANGKNAPIHPKRSSFSHYRVCEWCRNSLSGNRGKNAKYPREQLFLTDWKSSRMTSFCVPRPALKMDYSLPEGSKANLSPRRIGLLPFQENEYMHAPSPLWFMTFGKVSYNWAKQWMVFSEIWKKTWCEISG